MQPFIIDLFSWHFFWRLERSSRKIISIGYEYLPQRDIQMKKAHVVDGVLMKSSIMIHSTTQSDDCSFYTFPVSSSRRVIDSAGAKTKGFSLTRPVIG